jgi:hypothetical protein
MREDNQFGVDNFEQEDNQIEVDNLGKGDLEMVVRFGNGNLESQRDWWGKFFIWMMAWFF